MNLDTSTSLALMNARSGNTANALTNNKIATQSKEDAKVDLAAKEFEAMFVAQMLQPMFEGLSTDGLFGGGKGEEIFRGFMIEEYGKMMAETGQLGIADNIKAEMIRMQAKQTGGASETTIETMTDNASEQNTTGINDEQE